MSPVLLRRLAAILIVALVVWAGLARLRRSQTDRSIGVQLPALTPGATDTIRYAGPADTIVLARHEANWTVNGFPAARPVVTAFFRAVTDSSTRSELVAESAASHARLGVDSLKATHLTVRGGGATLLDLSFGSRGPDFDGFYVRQGEDPRVFLLRGTFANLTVQSLEEWRDKVMLAAAADSIGAVEVDRGRTHWRVERDGAGWRLAGAGAADSVKVRHYLTTFVSVPATGFPTAAQVDSAPFAPAERRVQLFGRGGAVLGRMDLDSMPWGWMVRTTDGPGRYKLDQRTVEQLTPESGSLTP